MNGMFLLMLFLLVQNSHYISSSSSVTSISKTKKDKFYFHESYNNIYNRLVGSYQGLASEIELLGITPDEISYKVYYTLTPSPETSNPEQRSLEFFSTQLINRVEYNYLILEKNRKLYSIGLNDSVAFTGKLFQVPRWLVPREDDIFLKIPNMQSIVFQKGAIVSPLLLLGMQDKFLLYEGFYKTYLDQRLVYICIRSASLILSNQKVINYIPTYKDYSGLYTCEIEIPQRTIIKANIPFLLIYWALCNNNALNKDCIRYIMFLLKELRFL